MVIRSATSKQVSSPKTEAAASHGTPPKDVRRIADRLEKIVRGNKTFEKLMNTRDSGLVKYDGSAPKNSELGGLVAKNYVIPISMPKEGVHLTFDADNGATDARMRVWNSAGKEILNGFFSFAGERINWDQRGP